MCTAGPPRRSRCGAARVPGLCLRSLPCRFFACERRVPCPCARLSQRLCEDLSRRALGCIRRRALARCPSTRWTPPKHFGDSGTVCTESGVSSAARIEGSFMPGPMPRLVAYSTVEHRRSDAGRRSHGRELPRLKVLIASSAVDSTERRLTVVAYRSCGRWHRSRSGSLHEFGCPHS